MNASRILPWLALATLLALLPAAPVRAQVTGCTEIQVLPAEITVPGTYCLLTDQVGPYTGGILLEIKTNDVVLDCNGNAIRTTDDTNTTAAIYAVNKTGLVVRNCVVDNFYVAIFLSASTDPGSHLNRIEDNTVLNPRLYGINVIGSGNRIERNRVLQHQGKYQGIVRGLQVYSSEGKGIGNIIRDNTFADFRPDPPIGSSGDSTYAMYMFNLHDTLITGNTIGGLHAVSSWYVQGIYVSQSTGTVVSDNTILGAAPAAAPLGGQNYAGVHLSGTPEEQATNVCRDNVVGHFSDNIIGCIETGNVEF